MTPLPARRNKDRKTGDIRLDVKRPDAGFTHSTPVLADVRGSTQLLVSASNAWMAY